MVGAPPDNIGAKRLAEDGVPASGAGSANMGTKKLDSDPNYLHSYFPFAAPMVGAPPDNIGAQRLAEGGVPASGAGSAKMDAKKLESDPN